ncbi:uncharacterized protein LOC133305184 [Gastrolobium bilobum]|uniref:uncharacterized protein LOC133305184 n=1 Tax=Gastrolobium bilobum TaxID=150636 RepID=UPI002AB2922E|nr:uncharacterized protein LOC133305184 [Gastrolobium bilobum]
MILFVVTNIDFSKKVADMITQDRDWNPVALKQWLTPNAINILKNTLPPNQEDSPNKKSWRFGSNPSISIRNIYETLLNRGDANEERQELWSILWKWNGPQKIKILLWKILHGRLLTMKKISQWGERNKLRHGSTIPSWINREIIIRNLVKEIDDVFSNPNSHQLGRGTVIINISRLFPKDCYIKINTDGASRGKLGHVAYGGVLCDSNDKWLSGFAFKLGTCSSYKAELWGILRGLELAWNEGF